MWLAAGAQEHRPAPGLRVFSVLPDGDSRHKVLVIEGASNASLLAAAKRRLETCAADEWRPITSFREDRSDGRPNAFSCLFSNEDAGALLADFSREARTAMALTFNASQCRHLQLTEAASPGSTTFLGAALGLLGFGQPLPRRAWVLALHSELAPDLFH